MFSWKSSNKSIRNRILMQIYIQKRLRALLHMRMPAESVQGNAFDKTLYNLKKGRQNIREPFSENHQKRPKTFPKACL